MPFDTSAIRFVLVEPRIPENIGMSARALKNCGFSRLVLVGPPGNFRSAAACRPAMEAYPLIESAEIFADLPTAVAKSKLVVGTTRRGGRDRHPLLVPADLARDVIPGSGGSELSILFGAEKDGLSREAVDLCDLLVTIPAAPELPSFNLAQAVLLIAYEIFRASPPVPRAAEPADLATSESREGLYRHLERVLLRIGFLHLNNPGRILSSLRRLFGRAGLEAREVQILRGILSRVEWVLDKKRETEM